MHKGVIRSRLFFLEKFFHFTPRPPPCRKISKKNVGLKMCKKHFFYNGIPTQPAWIQGADVCWCLRGFLRWGWVGIRVLRGVTGLP